MPVSHLEFFRRNQMIVLFALFLSMWTHSVL
jgi:hypothetical protein